MSDETGRMSEEDKFLGIRTTITSPENTSDNSQKELFEEIEVEVVDDTPEKDQGFDVANYDHRGEIKKTKESAQDRISTLTAKFHSERRAKEKAKRLSDEAISYTQGIQTENQRLLRLVQDSQTALTEQSKYGADAALAIANENFKKAHESGDSGQIAAAQQALTNAQLAQASAPGVSQQIIDNWKQQVLAEQREEERAQPSAASQMPEPHPRAVEWQEQNPWFGVDKEMTSFAFGVHEKLVKDEGVDPSSPEYYDLINNRMKEVFPTHFGNDAAGSGESVVVETAPRRKASPVVAPAARNNGAIPRKVTLTSTQVSLAKRLGLTPQQYAQQLIKEMS